MAFLFGAFLGLVVGVAVVMAFARLENARAEQRRELAAIVASFSKLNVQDLRKLIPPEFYPSWVSFTQKQKLKWLNQELVKIFPFVNEVLTFTGSISHNGCSDFQICANLYVLQFHTFDVS